MSFAYFKILKDDYFLGSFQKLNKKFEIYLSGSTVQIMLNGICERTLAKNVRANFPVNYYLPLLLHFLSLVFFISAYKCKFCDRAFAQSNDLVKHTRSHVGENTYQCSLCPKAFRLHTELRQHGKEHFQEQKRKTEEQDESGTNISATSALSCDNDDTMAHMQGQDMIASMESSD